MQIIICMDVKVSLPIHYTCHTTHFVTSFRRMFYAYHQAVKDHHTNVMLSLFSIPKMCHKTFENWFINKKINKKKCKCF